MFMKATEINDKMKSSEELKGHNKKNVLSMNKKEGRCFRRQELMHIRKLIRASAMNY